MSITFLYDGVRMPGNIGTMIRNGDLLIHNSSEIKHIIISPDNNDYIPFYKSWIVNIIGWICDFFNLNARISHNNNFSPNGNFNSRARRAIKRFSCVSKNGSYSKLIFDPPDLDSYLENSIVIIFDNSPNSVNISELRSTHLKQYKDKNLIFVLGGESSGISEYMMGKANIIASIPTRKGISINVSNAQSILCYEINKLFEQ